VSSLHWKVETIVNFLVRLKVLLADPKVEAGALDLDSRIMKIFRTVISTWKNSIIKPIYLEKVVMLCKEEAALDLSNPKENEGTKTAKGAKTTKTASASSKTQNPPTPGKKSESKLVTSGMLSACLDIFTALTDESPSNEFLTSNPSQLKAILGACFRHVRQHDGSSIRSKLRIFIVGLYKGSCQVPTHEDVLLSVNTFLEKLIVETVSGSSAGSSSDNSRTSASRGKEKSEGAEDKDGESFIVQFALEIIEEVSKHRPDFFMVFSSSLLSLAASLLKKHLADTSAKQRQGVSHSPQSGYHGLGQAYATPVMGILDEACSQDPNNTMAIGVAKMTPAKHTSQLTDPIALGTPLRSLVIILRLLGASEIPFVFTEERKSFFQLLSSILESSDNVQLLMTAVKVVGQWLKTDISGGPLTDKERKSFLRKIASFDFFNGLPDVESQPLADLIAYYVFAFHGGKQSNVTTIASSEMEGTSNTGKDLGCDETIRRRSLVACLMNANKDTRQELLSLFVNRRSALSDSSSSFNDEDHPKILNSTPCTALEALWQLLNCDYEGLASRCWLVVFVELLLESAACSGGVQLAIEANEKTGSWLPVPKWKASNGSDFPIECAEYLRFCQMMTDQKAPSKNGLSMCLHSLRVLAHGDIAICRNLIEVLLPAAWDQIPNDGVRLTLVPALESLLAKPYYSQLFKQCKACVNERVSMNAVRFFLHAVLSFRPLPLLDTSLLVAVAENYNCWFEVLSLLEHQYGVLVANDVGSGSAKLRELTISAMRHCHRQLGDSDLWMGLGWESCILPESRWALALDMYGMVNDAAEAYSQLVDRYQTNDASVQRASEFELGLWEERWVELQRELCQQQVVSEFATFSENPTLLLESGWKSQDWDKVRQLLASPPLVSAVEAGDPAIKICETILAVADGKLSDVENSHAQAAQLCLYKWQQLPNISHGSHSHASLLHFFHRLVELRESGQIMVETSNHSTGHTLPDMKNILKYV
jgi:transformation/transcription domain-associated protein